MKIRNLIVLSFFILNLQLLRIELGQGYTIMVFYPDSILEENSNTSYTFLMPLTLYYLYCLPILTRLCIRLCGNIPLRANLVYM